MGTRGTLRIYLDGKLKVRQYNQWDSYPTGQVDGLGRFLASENNRRRLITVLKHLTFYTKDEVDDFSNEEGAKGNVFEQARFLYTTNRDWGYKILYLLCICPQMFYGTKTDDGEDVHYKLADWVDVFDEGNDLEPQEGNYVIELHTGSDEYRITGDWHGTVRDFYNRVPTEKELEEWEAEGNNAE